MPSDLRSRFVQAALAFIDPEGAVRKEGGGAVWGDAFTTFMGIASSGGSGPHEIKDTSADYAGARTTESYVFTCEQVRARAVSQVPLRCYEQDAEGKRKAIDHDALAVLDQTNPFGYVDGIPALMRMSLISLDTHGRSAWRLAFNRRKEPSEVYWQLPTQFSPIPDPKTFIRGIRVRDEDGVREIPYDEVCYFASDNPLDPLMGTSRIAVLKNPINLRAYSQYNNIDFFKNSMRPDWMLSGNFVNSEDNIARIRRGIRRMLSGANNRAPLILGEGMTAHLLTTSHEDAQWVEQQRLAQEEISSVFGVPLVYLNNLERMTYDNVKTAKLILWHDTMIPDLDDFGDRLTRRFLRRFWADAQKRRYVLAYDYSAVEGLGEDLALVWERVINMGKQYIEQVKARVLTPNQGRHLFGQLIADLGLDASPYNGDVVGGDTFYDLFQNVPIDQLSLQGIMDVWAMRGQNPEFVESVPGAPTAGDNADQVAARLNKPPEPPPLPPGPPPPALPPGPSEPPNPPAAPPPPPPAKAVDLDEIRRQVAGEIREQVERTVGEAAVEAFGKALERLQQPAAPAPDPQLERRLKRYFQDQQTDSLRSIRQAQAAGAAPADFYSKRIYEQRLVELVPAGVAAAVETQTRAALKEAQAGPLDGLASRVTAVFRDAIDRRAALIAAGKADATPEPAPDPLAGRPLHDQVIAAEEHYGNQVARSLRKVIDADKVASEWTALSGERKAGGATISADVLSLARQFASGLGLDLSGLSAVIRTLYADGWRLGIGAALKMLTGRDLPAESRDEAADIDWSAWTPGNPAAAQQAAGLADLLQQAGIVIQGVSDTTLDQIAQTLAQGAANGDSVQTIAKALTDILGDSDRALAIAHTELARAQSAASLETYRYNGVQGKSWLVFNPCPVCAQNEAAGTIPLDQSFPGGVQGPPQHTRCRCSVAPGTLGAATQAAAPSALVRKEQFYTTQPVPKEHDHSTEAGERAAIVFDLHGTITPSNGFTAPGQPGSMLPPFPAVKEGMDLLVAGGCCLHLATAALSPYHPPEVLAARESLVSAYLTAYGLPIAYVTGKVGAHVYVDDRAVPVVDGDWDAVMERVLEKLAARFDLGDDGIWLRKDIPEMGVAYDFPDPALIAGDQPRGLSTPVVDIDLHRCLLQASSSKLADEVMPGAVDAVSLIYNAGYTVRLSCAGWDPQTHTPEESAARLAGLRQQVRSAGVPYDEMVSKPHPDICVDDKSVGFTTWEEALPVILAKLATPHPEDEVTQRGSETPEA